MSIPTIERGTQIGLRIGELFPAVIQSCFETELTLFSKQIQAIEIKKPVFIMGLARSGTTAMAETLTNLPELGTSIYLDLPFPHIPIIWRRLTAKRWENRSKVPRIHGDGMEIDGHSPDSFEEIIWRQLAFRCDSEKQCQVLEISELPKNFSQTHRSFVRKVLCASGAARYVSKNNNNILRINFLRKIYPDARIVIMLREPKEHVGSLVRVHQRFCRMAATNPKMSQHLSMLGHFEFGPQRRPLWIDAESYQRTVDYWKSGRDDEGYLEQWMAVYTLALKTMKQDLAKGFAMTHAGQPGSWKSLSDYLEVDVSRPQHRTLRPSSAAYHIDVESKRLKQAEALYEELLARVF